MQPITTPGGTCPQSDMYLSSHVVAADGTNYVSPPQQRGQSIVQQHFVQHPMGSGMDSNNTFSIHQQQDQQQQQLRSGGLSVSHGILPTGPLINQLSSSAANANDPYSGINNISGGGFVSNKNNTNNNNNNNNNATQQPPQNAKFFAEGFGLNNGGKDSHLPQGLTYPSGSQPNFVVNNPWCQPIGVSAQGGFTSVNNHPSKDPIAFGGAGGNTQNRDPQSFWVQTAAPINQNDNNNNGNNNNNNLNNDMNLLNRGAGLSVTQRVNPPVHPVGAVNSSSSSSSSSGMTTLVQPFFPSDTTTGQQLINPHHNNNTNTNNVVLIQSRPDHVQQTAFVPNLILKQNAPQHTTIPLNSAVPNNVNAQHALFTHPNTLTANTALRSTTALASGVVQNQQRQFFSHPTTTKDVTVTTNGFFPGPNMAGLNSTGNTGNNQHQSGQQALQPAQLNLENPPNFSKHASCSSSGTTVVGQNYHHQGNRADEVMIPHPQLARNELNLQIQSFKLNPQQQQQQQNQNIGANHLSVSRPVVTGNSGNAVLQQWNATISSSSLQQTNVVNNIVMNAANNVMNNNNNNVMNNNNNNNNVMNNTNNVMNNNNNGMNNHNNNNFQNNFVGNPYTRPLMLQPNNNNNNNTNNTVYPRNVDSTYHQQQPGVQHLREELYRLNQQQIAHQSYNNDRGLATNNAVNNHNNNTNNNPTNHGNFQYNNNPNYTNVNHQYNYNNNQYNNNNNFNTNNNNPNGNIHNIPVVPSSAYNVANRANNNLQGDSVIDVNTRAIQHAHLQQQQQQQQQQQRNKQNLQQGTSFAQQHQVVAQQQQDRYTALKNSDQLLTLNDLIAFDPTAGLSGRSSGAVVDGGGAVATGGTVAADGPLKRPRPSSILQNIATTQYMNAQTVQHMNQMQIDMYPQLDNSNLPNCAQLQNMASLHFNNNNNNGNNSNNNGNNNNNNNNTTDPKTLRMLTQTIHDIATSKQKLSGDSITTLLAMGVLTIKKSGETDEGQSDSGSTATYNTTNSSDVDIVAASITTTATAAPVAIAQTVYPPTKTTKPRAKVVKETNQVPTVTTATIQQNNIISTTPIISNPEIDDLLEKEYWPISKQVVIKKDLPPVTPLPLLHITGKKFTYSTIGDYSLSVSTQPLTDLWRHLGFLFAGNNAGAISRIPNGVPLNSHGPNPFHTPSEYRLFGNFVFDAYVDQNNVNSGNNNTRNLLDSIMHLVYQAIPQSVRKKHLKRAKDLEKEIATIRNRGLPIPHPGIVLNFEPNPIQQRESLYKATRVNRYRDTLLQKFQEVLNDYDETLRLYYTALHKFHAIYNDLPEVLTFWPEARTNVEMLRKRFLGIYSSFQRYIEDVNAAIAYLTSEMLRVGMGLYGAAIVELGYIHLRNFVACGIIHVTPPMPCPQVLNTIYCLGEMIGEVPGYILQCAPLLPQDLIDAIHAAGVMLTPTAWKELRKVIRPTYPPPSTQKRHPFDDNNIDDDDDDDDIDDEYYDGAGCAYVPEGTTTFVPVFSLPIPVGPPPDVVAENKAAMAKYAKQVQLKEDEKQRQQQQQQYQQDTTSIPAPTTLGSIEIPTLPSVDTITTMLTTTATTSLTTSTTEFPLPPAHTLQNDNTDANNSAIVAIGDEEDHILVVNEKEKPLPRNNNKKLQMEVVTKTPFYEIIMDANCPEFCDNMKNYSNILFLNDENYDLSYMYDYTQVLQRNAFLRDLFADPTLPIPKRATHFMGQRITGGKDTSDGDDDGEEEEDIENLLDIDNFGNPHQEVYQRQNDLTEAPRYRTLDSLEQNNNNNNNNTDNTSKRGTQGTISMVQQRQAQMYAPLQSATTSDQHNIELNDTAPRTRRRVAQLNATNTPVIEQTEDGINDNDNNNNDNADTNVVVKVQPKLVTFQKQRIYPFILPHGTNPWVLVKNAMQHSPNSTVCVSLPQNPLGAAYNKIHILQHKFAKALVVRLTDLLGLFEQNTASLKPIARHRLFVGDMPITANVTNKDKEKDATTTTTTTTRTSTRTAMINKKNTKNNNADGNNKDKDGTPQQPKETTVVITLADGTIKNYTGKDATLVHAHLHNDLGITPVTLGLPPPPSLLQQLEQAVALNTTTSPNVAPCSNPFKLPLNCFGDPVIAEGPQPKMFPIVFPKHHASHYKKYASTIPKSTSGVPTVKKPVKVSLYSTQYDPVLHSTSLANTSTAKNNKKGKNANTNTTTQTLISPTLAAQSVLSIKNDLEQQPVTITIPSSVQLDPNYTKGSSIHIQHQGEQKVVSLLRPYGLPEYSQEDIISWLHQLQLLQYRFTVNNAHFDRLKQLSVDSPSRRSFIASVKDLNKDLSVVFRLSRMYFAKKYNNPHDAQATGKQTSIAAPRRRTPSTITNLVTNQQQTQQQTNPQQYVRLPNVQSNNNNQDQQPTHRLLNEQHNTEK